MEEITSSVVLPVTDAQMRAFSAWVIETYVTYDVFMDAIHSPAVDTYIKTHILPQEMTHVLRVSERFRGEKWGDVNIQRLLLYRRRVTAKMNNLKGKVATFTFPFEAAQVRRANREAATARRQYREATQIRLDQEALAYRDYLIETIRQLPPGAPLPFPEIKLPTIVTLAVTLAEEATLMDDDCAICLQKHKMTDACKINCGHQFGSVCLAKWKRDTCPLCRTKVTETTVFVAPVVLPDVDLLIFA